MSPRIAIAAALVTTGLLTPVAFAQSRSPQRPAGQAVTRPDGITARQRLQHRRVQAGQKRGAISAAERGRLLARQQQIRTLKEQLRSSGGRLDRRERLRLHRQLNLLSRAIRRAGRG